MAPSMEQTDDVSNSQSRMSNLGCNERLITCAIQTRVCWLPLNDAESKIPSSGVCVCGGGTEVAFCRKKNF